MKGKLSDLKLEKVRKTIKYELGGVEKEIVIYNAIGKKRENLLKILQTGSRLSDKDKAADMLYKSILKELVEIDIDVKNTNILLKAPTKTLMELNHEIDEMLFELQYEFITGQMRKLNMTKISTLTALSLERISDMQKDVEKLQNANVQ